MKSVRVAFESLMLNVGFLVVLAGFQNCSKANFSSSGSSAASSLSTAELPPTNSTVAPLVCSAGQDANATAEQFYPTQYLVNPELPVDSLGLEVNEPYRLVTKGAPNFIELNSNSPAGTSQDTQLYIEVATYAAPDTVVLYAVDASGNETKILDICNIATYSKGDPSGGIKRPYSDTILQFNVVMPKGTVQLKFDYSEALTPTYVGVWGLNEFSAQLADSSKNPFNAIKHSNFYRVVSGLPAELNDNADPLAGAPVCSN